MSKQGKRMCKCTPEIRTPFCGKPGCEWPQQKNVRRAWPNVFGVSRVADNSKAVMVVFDREPTDNELRAMHDRLRA